MNPKERIEKVKQSLRNLYGGGLKKTKRYDLWRSICLGFYLKRSAVYPIPSKDDGKVIESLNQFCDKQFDDMTNRNRTPAKLGKEDWDKDFKFIYDVKMNVMGYIMERLKIFLNGSDDQLIDILVQIFEAFCKVLSQVLNSYDLCCKGYSHHFSLSDVVDV